MMRFLTHIDASLSRILRLPEYASTGALPAATLQNRSAIARVLGDGLYYQAGTEWIRLTDLITAVYRGIATPATTPADTSGFWIASEPGTYTDFPDASSDPLVLTGFFAILTHDGSGWIADELNLVTRINDTPIAYVPTATGNTDNLNEIVTASDGTMWFIDLEGKGHRFTITAGDIQITDPAKGLIQKTMGGQDARYRILDHGALQVTLT
jgi:streptogramin lyase